MIDIFSGIGGAETALDHAGIEYEATVCESYPQIHELYTALHGETFNYGDVTLMDELPDADLLFFDWPTNKIFLGRGKEEISSPAWCVIKLLNDARAKGKLPEYLCMETSQSAVTKNYLNTFKSFIKKISDLGYTVSYKVMGYYDFGVPHNRKRTFIVASLHHGEFTFPEPCTDVRPLKDVLEPEEAVSKMWLSPEDIAIRETIFRTYPVQNVSGWVPSDISGLCPNLTLYVVRRSAGVYLIMPLPGDPDQDRRIPVSASDRHNVEEAIRGNLRIRRVSLLEFWRLHGYTDDEYRKAASTGMKRYMLYRVGASVSAVPCWTAIFKAMFIDKTWEKAGDSVLEQSVLDFGRE